MLTTNQQAVMTNYRTLACEVVLKAHNDLALALIDLKCLAKPEKSEFSERRYDYLNEKITNRTRNEHRFTLRHTDPWECEEVYSNFYKAEMERFMMHRASTAKMCKKFLTDGGTMVTMLDLDGDNIVRHAEDVADRWIRTGRLHLKKSVRSENFDKYTERLEE